MEKQWKIIAGILVFSFLIRLVFLLKNPPLWWDSAVYIGIAKYMFSLGHVGLWEPYRPLFWPLLIGFWWKLGANPIIAGKIMEMVFSLGTIFFVFEIARKLFSIKIAIISSLLFAIDPILFEFNYVLYNEVPALFFGLVAVYLFMLYRERRATWMLALSGIFSCFAFLTRFPTGIIFGSVLLFLVIELLFNLIKKKILLWKDIAIFSAAFVITSLPYFIFNYMLYNGNFLYPLTEAAIVIEKVALAATTVSTNWGYYLLMLPIKSFILIFSVIGLIVLIYTLTKRFKADNNLLVILLTVLPIIYTQCLTVKDVRYAIVFLPFMYILSVYGLFIIAKHKNRIIKSAAIIIIIAAFAVNLSYCYHVIKFLPEQQQAQTDYYSYFSSGEYYGTEVLSTTPHLIAYSDIKLIPIYNAEAIDMDRDMEKAIIKYSPQYIAAGIPANLCSTKSCFNTITRMLETINQSYREVYNKTYNSDKYIVFKLRR